MTKVEQNWRRAAVAQKLATHFVMCALRQWLMKPNQIFLGAISLVLRLVVWLVRSCAFISVRIFGIFLSFLLYAIIYMGSILGLIFLCCIYCIVGGILAILAIGTYLLIWYLGFVAFRDVVLSFIFFDKIAFDALEHAYFVEGLILAVGSGLFLFVLDLFWGEEGKYSNLNDIILYQISGLRDFVIEMTTQGGLKVKDWISGFGDWVFVFSGRIKNLFGFFLNYAFKVSTDESENAAERAHAGLSLQSLLRYLCNAVHYREQQDGWTFEIFGVSILSRTGKSFQIISIGIGTISVFSLPIFSVVTLFSVTFFEWPFSFDDILDHIEIGQPELSRRPTSNADLVEMYRTSNLVQVPSYWQFSSSTELTDDKNSTLALGSALPKPNLLCRFRLIVVIGAASPPGAADLNFHLSRSRALNITNVLKSRIGDCASDVTLIAAWIGENSTFFTPEEALRLRVFGVTNPSDEISVHYLNSLVNSFIGDAQVGAPNRMQPAVEYCLDRADLSDDVCAISSGLTACRNWNER